MIHMRKLLASVALAAALSSGAAKASVVLSDNFDGEHGGTSALNYAGFANWDVTGKVDLVRQADYGINCVTGSCVDLDGTTGPGKITTKSSYSFNVGDTVTLTWALSGNQRGGGADNFLAGFVFGGATQTDNVTFFGTNFGSFNGSSLNGTLLGVASSYAWTTSSFSFVAGSAGTLKAYLGTESADNVGPVVDNVSLSITGGVPEPATWAMMILGFGFAGAALRRRRAAFA